MSAFLALLSAVTFGAGDFLGGIATRRTRSAITVVVTSQLVGLALVAAVLLVVGGDLDSGDWVWAGGAGVCGASGLLLLYRGLSIGTMSLVAPVSAILTAVVPVGWGLVTGERPSLVAGLGVGLALLAVILVSGAGSPGGLRVGPGILEAIGAGFGFGIFFILIAETTSAELWTLTFARVASISVLAVVAAVGRISLRPAGGAGGVIAAAGVFDMVANLLFLLAERRGLLTLVAVITSLYPASTVLLARVVLHERLARTQVIGLGLAATGIALISAG